MLSKFHLTKCHKLMKAICDGGMLDGHKVEVKGKPAVGERVVVETIYGDLDYYLTAISREGLPVLQSEPYAISPTLKAVHEIIDMTPALPKRHLKHEKEARTLRDRIYGQTISDKSWAYCREHWIADLKWLREQAAKKAK